MFDVTKTYRIKFHSKMGKAYFAPKHVTRRSANVLKINAQLIALRGKDNHPVRQARKACIDEGKYTEVIAYKGGQRVKVQRVDWNCFLSALRKIMRKTIKTVVPGVPLTTETTTEETTTGAT